MNLHGDMRAFASEHGDWSSEQLAEGFISQRVVSKKDFLPLVVEEFKWIARRAVRTLEFEAFRAQMPAPRSAESVRAALSDLAPLIDKPYRIGDGNVRRFGELTVDEHHIRVLMLRANVNGLQRDIAMHETAIALCEQHGVSCLDEIGAAVAA